MGSATESEWLSPEDLATSLKIPVRTTYAWRQRNYGPPAIRVGKHIRYRASDVEAWLDAQADDRQPA